MAVRAIPYVTPHEYLDQDRQAEVRSEYYDGVIVAMAGATWEHTQVKDMLAGLLNAAPGARGCVASTSDLRVRASDCNRYFYPDVVVVCGEPQFEDDRRDTLLNPVVLMEVLLESTERIDRGDKLLCYQTLESLAAYVLVAQDAPRVETYERQPDGSWRYTLTQGLDSAVRLEAVGCHLPLSAIYARVQFLAASGSEPEVQS